MTVSLIDDQWVVESPNGVSSESCTANSATSVRCYHFNDRFGSTLRDGNDSIDLSTTLLRGGVRAGHGNDTVIGSGARNVVLGGYGRDGLSGRGGNDVLRGDHGADSFAGGQGDDIIYAIDNQRDQRISCGAGNDRAYIDREIDPRPVGCEHVSYKVPSGG